MVDDSKHGLLRREYLKRAGAAGAAGAAGLSGCLGGGGGSVGSITVGIWGGSWQELMNSAVIEPYQDETGVSVEQVVGDNTDRFNKLIAQRQNPPVDVSQQDGGGLVRGANEDLWMSLDEEMVPRLSEVPDQFKADSWVLQIFAASALLYNTDKMDSAPNSWEAYLNPEYAGRIGLFTQDPTHDLLAFALHQTDGEDPTAMDQAFEMYEEVVQEMDPVYITSSDEYGNRWKNGELDISRYWSARAAQWAQDDAPVGFSIPDAGAFTTNFGNAIPKNIAEEKVDAAGEFINYTLKEGAAKEVAKQMYYTNPIPVIDYPESVQDNLIQQEDLESLQVPPFDFIAENRNSWQQRVQQIINENQ